MDSAKSLSYNKKGKGTIISLEQGKIPPQALDLEEAVLGINVLCARVQDQRDLLSRGIAILLGETGYMLPGHCHAEVRR